jgi:hypothetical protein
MRLPFVSRARFEDREQHILGLKKELAELKFEHARVLDEIVFRSTGDMSRGIPGFHLDPRFATAAPPADVAPAQPAEPEKNLGPVAEAINKVGTRPTAVRRYMENQSLSHLEQAEAEARRGREIQSQDEVRQRMEAILEKTKPQAATA